MLSVISGTFLAVGLMLQEGANPPAELLLHPPRPLTAPPVVLQSVDYIRPNPYDVWQAYGVDRYGQFRARVLPTPHGFRYVFNGSPYPWWPTSPENVVPMVVQPAVFDQVSQHPGVLLPIPSR